MWVLRLCQEPWEPRSIKQESHLLTVWVGPEGLGAFGCDIKGCWGGGMKEARPGSLAAPGTGGVGEESEGSLSRALLAAELKE